jgi:hypothetical protein
MNLVLCFQQCHFVSWYFWLQERFIQRVNSDGSKESRLEPSFSYSFHRITYKAGSVIGSHAHSMNEF